MCVCVCGFYIMKNPLENNYERALDNNARKAAPDAPPPAPLTSSLNSIYLSTHTLSFSLTHLAAACSPTPTLNIY